ncbi:hypothetical protein PSTT_04209, partial [Puccinia striiformis]
YLISNSNAFTCHLSFTLDNFYNEAHTNKDLSPCTFVTWIPINQQAGELAEDHFEVEGGEFVFPKDGCAVDFMRFNSIVECAWKASDHFHHTLPSPAPMGSPHTQLGISSQLPESAERALQTHQDEIPDYKKLWTIRDLEKVVKDAVTKYDEKGKLREPNKKKKQPKPK